MPKQKKQILSKLRWHVIHALNMRKEDTQEQTEPMFDPYKDGLEDVINSNIDDRVPGKNNPLQPSKSNTSTL